MKTSLRRRVLLLAVVFLCAGGVAAAAQGNSSTIRGVVKDQAGAVVAGATVVLSNSLTGYAREAITDGEGAYQLLDVPFNRYLLAVSANGFQQGTSEVVVRANLVQHVDVQLCVNPVRQEVTVEGVAAPLDADRTAPGVTLDQSAILRFPTAEPSRSAEGLISTVPGWTLDANGRLHARGIEHQVQYSIDGIPITDTIASTFAASPDPRNFSSVEVTTADIPAEYGDKLAGIIAVNTRSGLELPTSGHVTLSGGSFSTAEASMDLGGHSRKVGYFISTAGSTSDRFLDPPALENFHNDGATQKGFLKLDYGPDQTNLVRFNLFLDRQRFDVPNLPDQEDEGQNQGRRTHDNMESVSWQHVFSDHAVSYISGYQRYSAADLVSNSRAVPVFAEQSRHQSNYGVLASLTSQVKRHTIKGGAEFKRFPVTEAFTFAITDRADLIGKEPDLPEDVRDFDLGSPFLFNYHRAGWEGAVYVQDHINATPNLTFDLGVRFDSYHFLVDTNFVSPRLGAAYHIAKTGTVLRAALNRLLETPALENLLLSSSEKARIFSSGDEEEALKAQEENESGDLRGEPVQPSREWQVDVGFQQQISRFLRLDADYYYRRLTNPPEITNFLETGIIFPANLDRSRSRGVEARLDLARVHGFSGHVSYTNLHIYGFAPITGGLFLGEAIDLRERAGQRVNIEEDQRNTVVFEALYDKLPAHFWLAFGGRHDSGFSVELEPDSNAEEFAQEFPKEILDRVNFDRGFIRPHTVLGLSIGRDFALNDHVGLSGQVNFHNLTDEFYLITFESVFSGTTVGRQRSYSGKLSFSFK
jgi:outer membrane receptor protein involved in Fe transport